MNSSDDQSHRRPDHSEEENPFIAFRRYADEQMSSLLRSVLGLPSAFKLPSSDSRWLPYDEEARRRAMDSWGGSPQHEGRWEPGRGREWPYEQEKTSAVEIPVKTYTESTDAVPEEDKPLRCPYRPMDSDYDQQPPTRASNNDYDDRDPWQHFVKDFPVMRSFAPLHMWPAAAYLMLSPYSPLALEQKDHFREHGDKWRHAFEDLIDAQSGKGLQSRPARSEPMNSSDWLHYMLGRKESQVAQPRGLIGQLATRQPENDVEEEESLTELDLYERFLGTQFPGSSSKPSLPLPSSHPPSKEQTSESAEPGKASVVSTLTTSERTTLPDGRVYSRMVLKKRFADGREESSETVQTTEGPQGQQKGLPALRDESAQGTSVGKDERQQEKAKKGWFWS